MPHDHMSKSLPTQTINSVQLGQFRRYTLCEKINKSICQNKTLILFQFVASISNLECFEVVDEDVGEPELIDELQIDWNHLAGARTLVQL